MRCAPVLVLAVLPVALPWGFPFGGDDCGERKRVLLFGDSLTEGLLGNACLYRPAPRPRGQLRAARAGTRPECFHPYALRVGDRFAGDGAAVTTNFLTRAPSGYPSGVRTGGGCGGAVTRGITLEESGISGERAGHMVPRLKALLKERDCYDAVAILAGTNDLLVADAAGILASLRQLRDVAKRRCPDARVLHVTLPELYGDAWPAAAATRAAVNRGLPPGAAVDWDGASCRTCAAAGKANRSAYWDADAIHFTEAGYDAFGDAVYDALAAALADIARARRDTTRRRRLASLYK